MSGSESLVGELPLELVTGGVAARAGVAVAPPTISVPAGVGVGVAAGGVAEGGVAAATGTVTIFGSEPTFASPNLAPALAVLTTEPAETSAAVTVYVAVQTIVSP